MSFRKEELAQSLPDRFEEQVRRYPERIALRFGPRSLTYEGLNTAANRVAHAILERRGVGEEPVAFLIGHGVEQIVAMLGILKSGKIYLPIDPSYPQHTMSMMLRAAEAPVIVTTEANVALVEGLREGDRQVICLDTLDANLPCDNPGLHIPPDAIASIYYTSGSTGDPKGVTQTHRNVLHFVMIPTNTWPIEPEDRYAHLIPCSFSAAAWPVFGALLNGAALVPFDPRRLGLGRLADWMKNERITIYFSVPSVFRQFLAGLTEETEFPHLRLVVLTGETVYRNDFEQFKRHFSQGCIFRNILASAETLLIRAYVLDKSGEVVGNIVPVGYGVEDKEVLLLNERGEEVAAGEVGEIVVRSRYSSPGYWRRRDLTDAVFAVDPAGGEKRLYRSGDLGRMTEDGCLIHLGRKDSMVKVRGQRVELGEVETTLLDQSGVKAAVVVARVGKGDTVYLVAYVVPEEGRMPTVAALRAGLAEKLPAFMIPSVFVPLEALPLLPNGKVDRKALPDPIVKRAEVSGTPLLPRDNLELQVAQVCEEMVGVSPIGVTDNLFDLGLDSLGYVALVLELEKRLARNVPVEGLWKAETVEDITNLFRRKPLPTLARLRESALSYRMGRALTQATSALGKGREVAHCLFLWAFAPIVSYGAGSRVFAAFCGNGWVQSILFRRRVRELRLLLKSGRCEGNEAEVIHQSLTRNSIQGWRYASLSGMTTRNFDKWVTVIGAQNLREASQKGKGVVLVNSHFALAFLALLVLRRLGYDDVVTIQVNAFMFRVMGLKGSKGRFLLGMPTSPGGRANSLYLAHRVLGRGGIAHLAADGYQGESGVISVFQRRLRSFKTGAAELSLNTGADLIPVLIAGESTGRSLVEFGKPLSRGTDDMSRQERIALIIRQYVSLLERRWMEDPGSISNVAIRRFLSLPEAHREIR